METIVYSLACALPLLVLGLRMLLARRLAAGWRLALDLALLAVSVPVAIEIIGRALHFPADVGDHSPGIGVVFVPLLMVWTGCMLAWVGRLGWLAVRRMHAPA